ncbi:MAG: glycosyltransferase family 2 protein [Clostridium sp.]|nr:MAG: glycosyltransferase family 2 protein [Clostridium sp.]
MQVLLSGTGFFFKSSILRKYCGWPFHTLTEDYELTNYSIINNLKSTYVDDAIYYDEQPLKLHQSIVQRTRWIKGYFKVRAMYDKKKVKALKENKHKTSNSFAQVIGAIPMFVIAFDLIYYLLLLIICLITSLFIERNTSLYYLYRLIGVFGGLYILAVIFTAILFFLERKKQLKLKKWNKIKVTLFHPIFFY